MTRAIFITFILFSLPVGAADTFLPVAESEIRELVRLELWGHYDIESVSVLETKDHAAQLNGPWLKTVVARFVAARNTTWNKQLSQKIADHCDKAGSVYLLCQSAGHKFAGKLEVDMALTTSGWKILDRNYQSLRAFPLSGYLLLEGRSKEGYVLSPKQNAY